MSIVLELAGQRLELVGDRAVWWPARATLLLADIHFGKAEVFRRHGIALPHGSTAHDLARLDRLLARWPARRLLVLGDLVHGPAPESAGWRQVLGQWLAVRSGLEMAVVRGNHDRHLPPEDLGIQALTEPSCEDGLWLAHEPEALPGPGLCGHVHPVRRISAGRLRERVPVFWLSGDHLVLPAWGAMTGGHPVEPAPGDRVFAALDDEVLALPGVRSARGRRELG